MQRLIDMPTSELIQTATQYSASIKEVGIYSELVKELTTRLGANTAAVTQALKERDEARLELSSAQLTISQITKVMGTSDTLSISDQISVLNQQVVNLAVENAALTSGCGFFAYDPDNGFEDFKTKDEAIEAAESYIDYYRGDACDGWDDQVSQVSWGVVMQQSTKVDERPKNAEDSVSDYIDTVCDYALLPVIASPATDVAIANIEANGVEKFAQHPALGIISCGHIALEFAAQLRKEAGK